MMVLKKVQPVCNWLDAVSAVLYTYWWWSKRVYGCFLFCQGKNVVNDCHLTPIFYADSQHLDKK